MVTVQVALSVPVYFMYKALAGSVDPSATTELAVVAFGNTSVP